MSNSIADFDPAWLALLSEEEQKQFAVSLEMLVGGEDLRSFVNRIAPSEPPPKHLTPVIDVLEQARIRPIRAVIDMGPGHAKTTMLLRGLAWWLSKSPADLCAYVTHSDTQARDKSRIAKEALEKSGGELRADKTSDGDWRTPQGGGLVARGSKGGLTGKRIPGMLIYDDPYKDMQEARSVAINSMVIERFKGVAFTRLQGGSIIVLHTRWAVDDLIGYILRNLKWDQISIPSICDSVSPTTGRDRIGRTLGEEAWPEKYPYELCLEDDGKTRKICGHDGHLKEIRLTVGEHMWAALYQGQPRPEGQLIFHEPARFSLKDFSWIGKRGVISVDPAATAKTSADHSAIALLAMEGYGLNARMWIIDMIRIQVEIPELVNRIRRLQLKTRLMAAIEAVGGFKGVGQSLRAISARDEAGRQIGTLRVLDINPGTKDKFTKAQPVAAAWNDSRVLVPEDADWADGLIDRFQRFTGVGNQPDDEIDTVGQGWTLLYRERPKQEGSRQELM